MIVPWLSYGTGIYAAGALMMWAAFVMPPLAGLLIAQTLHGRVSWVALLGFLAMFNQNMQWGFVNFAVSTGLALIGFALWIRTVPTAPHLDLRPLRRRPGALPCLGFLLFGYLVLLWGNRVLCGPPARFAGEVSPPACDERRRRYDPRPPRHRTRHREARNSFRKPALQISSSARKSILSGRGLRSSVLHWRSSSPLHWCACTGWG